MAIESTYQSLLGGQRKRRKKQERNDMLVQAGTLATNVYQSKLDSQAEDFFNRSEVSNQRVKYQEGRDLYENKIKKLYDQGSAYVGGHGEYLVANQAKQIAQERIYANMDEENVFDTDDLGSAITSYSRELVYGKKGEDGTISEEDKKQGMLYRLEQAYNSGKNLASMDKYDEYVSKRADLPENVGGALMNKLVRRKSRSDIESDALNRVVNENNFVKGSEAFVALSKSFDAGLSVKDSEKLAQQIQERTKDIKMKPFVTATRRLVDTETMGDFGKTIKWQYVAVDSVNRRTGKTTTTYEPNLVNEQHAKMFNKENVVIRSQGEKLDITHPYSGQPTQVPTTLITNFNGEKTAQIIDESSLFDAGIVAGQLKDLRISGDLMPSAAYIEGASNAVNNVLSIIPKGGGQDLRDASNDFFNRFYGEDADIDYVKKNFNIQVSNQAAAIQKQYGVDRPLALRLSATMALKNHQYMADMDDRSRNYQGANILSSESINGLRVFEALNYLNMNDPELDLRSLGGNETTAHEKIASILITGEQLKRFAGKGGGSGTLGSLMDMNSRKYYIKNIPSDPAEYSNLYNTKNEEGKTIRDMILEEVYEQNPELIPLTLEEKIQQEEDLRKQSAILSQN